MLLRWRLDGLRSGHDAKVIVCALLLGALVAGGFVTALTVAHTSPAAGAGPDTRVVTLRQKIRVHEHGRVVTHWRIRKVYAQARTVLEAQTIRTPKGVRLVVGHGTSRTVMQPVTDTRVLTRMSTQLGTVTRETTNTQVVTVTHPVTVVATTTIVSTETQTLPITVTVTIP